MAREFRPPLRGSKAPVILASVFGVVTLAGAVILTLVALGSSQVSYRIESGTLTIESGSFIDGKRSFPLANVTDARTVTVSQGRRTRGTGAPGLCTGLWWYPETGAVWQATNCSARVAMLTVTGEEQPVLVSPPDPEAFVAEISAGTNDTIFLAPGDVTIMRVVPGTGAALLLLSSVMLTMVFVVGPKRMRYVIDGGELTVQTIFSRRSWPVHELKARAHLPRVTMRVAGTAFPGYYTGLFRCDGATTRVYATDLKSPGVLIEGPARVFLSPQNPAAFLAALAESGASCTSEG